MAAANAAYLQLITFLQAGAYKREDGLESKELSEEQGAELDAVRKKSHVQIVSGALFLSAMFGDRYGVAMSERSALGSMASRLPWLAIACVLLGLVPLIGWWTLPPGSAGAFTTIVLVIAGWIGGTAVSIAAITRERGITRWLAVCTLCLPGVEILGISIWVVVQLFASPGVD